MKLEVQYATTSVRKISNSNVTTIPKNMADLLGIKPGTKVNWEFDPSKGYIKVSKAED